MFGKKKSSSAAGERGREEYRGQGGYYRQEDYYAQRPEGARYYDTRAYGADTEERRGYARPGYDQRYVSGAPESGPERYPHNSGSMSRGTAPEGYSRYEGKEVDGRRFRQDAPYMEAGYGQRVYERSYGTDPFRTGEAPRQRTVQEVGRDPYGSSGRRREFPGAVPPAKGGGNRRYEDAGGRRPRRKVRAWKIILELLLLLILAGGVFAFAKLGEIDRTRLEHILTNEGLAAAGGYTNVVLYGVDSREGALTKDCHSDTIMIISLNRRSREVKIASVYRDTYLDNTNGEYRKATECYFYGGPERSINMLNKNLDLNIKDYVAVNFNAVVQVIDLLGGIDLEITEEEMQYINGYCVENQQVTGVSYTPLTTAGFVHLDGIQALAYCRIRYTEGWDFKRTERQRTVLTLVYQKAAKQGPGALLGIANTMLPEISTSMSNVELLGLVAGIGTYRMGEQTGFPFDQTAADLAVGDCVVPVNLAANVTQLHEFLFGEIGYVPSATVMEISNEIINATGIG